MAEYSVLTPFLGSPDLEEINVNGWDDIALTYLDGSIVKLKDHFHSPQHAVDIIKRLLHHSGMIIDNATPTAQGHLPGNTRITALKDPIVDEDRGVSVSIRLLHPSRVTRENLVETGFATQEMVDFLCMCIRYGVPFVVAGATSSGKTTLHIRDALEATGKSKQFTLSCAASVVLLVVGCILAVVIDNYFLIPVFAVAFAALPFFVARSTISAYDKHIKEEMETALSIITPSYIRSDDIVAAVQENIPQLKPPIREIFQGFVGETMMISSNMKDALRNLKDKIDNDIYAEWCDTLIACQDDRTLKDTLLPIVAKLTDVRIVNNELKTLLGEVKKEYWMMVCLVVCNIPLLYVLNKDWYDALMFTLPGKIVLAICGVVILITAVLMMKYTRPVEYKR